jgi:4-coumarate--CoA ligase (photoactive yellow protein activation family)
MTDILDRKRLEVLVNEIFWHTNPSYQETPFEGDLKEDLRLDSIAALDLAAEFHFRFDMLSGDKDAYLFQYTSAKDWMNQIYRAANDPKRRFGFFSSGSSGTPKQIYHMKSDLLEERDYWLQRTKAKGVICLVPTRHIYGFIWSLLMGSKLKRAIFLKTEEWNQLAELATDGDLIIGHPSSWQQVSTPFSHRLAISSTAPIDKSLTDSLSSKGVKGINVYGSTETGGIAWQSWRKELFELLPFWEKKDNHLSRKNQIVSIPDHLEWTTDRDFKIMGRKDEVVQIGGENVSLQMAKESLLEIPGVKEVWVKPFEAPWGTRLYAYFQLHPDEGKKPFEQKLKHHIHSLPASFKPRKWDIGYTPFSKFDE